MKKIILFIIAIATCITLSVYAKDPNFSLKNKSGESIFIELGRSTFAPGESMQEPIVPCILKGIKKAKGIMKSETVEDITTTQCQIGEGYIFRLGADRSLIFDIPGDVYALSIWSGSKIFRYLFGLKPNQKMYVKFDGSLKQQDGTGLIGNKKTTEGYSLKGQIKLPEPLVSPSSVKEIDRTKALDLENLLTEYM